MTKKDKAVRNERSLLCTELPKLQARMLACGMTQTAILLQDAIKKSGWEVAQLIEGATK